MRKTGRIFTIVLLSFLYPALLYPSSDLEHLATGSIEQQITAMYFFGYSKNKACFWYLVKNLGRTFEVDDSGKLGERFRQVAAESLGRLGDDRAVPFLVKQYGQEKTDSVKRSIIFALGFYKHKDIVPVLQDGLQSENADMLCESIFSAANYEDTGLSAQIKIVYEKQKDPLIKLLASYALVVIGDEPDTYAGVLKKELGNEDPVMRYWAAHCLSKTDRVDAIDDIVKALGIENRQWVKREMESALILLAVKKKNLYD